MLLWLTMHVVHAAPASSTHGDSLEVSPPAFLQRRGSQGVRPQLLHQAETGAGTVLLRAVRCSPAAVTLSETLPEAYSACGWLSLVGAVGVWRGRCAAALSLGCCITTWPCCWRPALVHPQPPLPVSVRPSLRRGVGAARTQELMWAMDVEGDADLLLGATAKQLRAMPSAVVTGMQRGEKRESVRQRVEQSKQTQLDNMPSSVCDDPVSTLRPPPPLSRLPPPPPLRFGCGFSTMVVKGRVHRDTHRQCARDSLFVVQVHC
jgi:hypothetical protein